MEAGTKGFLKWVLHPQTAVCAIVLALAVAALGSAAGSLGKPLQAYPHAPQVAPAFAPPERPDCSAVPCLALTFDDGPSETTTPRILDILARQQVKATFFIVGQHVAGHEAILQREHQEGHEIGNHSWSHPDLATLSPEAVESQLQRTQQAIAKAGVPIPRLLRPPYGSVNKIVASHNHLTVVRWNIDPEDWKSKDANRINEQLMAQVRPGGIILLHDMDPATADALEPALRTLKRQYQFVTVSELLNLSPGDQGQYFGR